MTEPQLPFNSTEFAAAWNEWLQYRKENRFRPYKPIGLRKTFKQLVEYSHNNEVEAIGILDQSMANTWQGLFPLKNKVNGNSTANKPGTSEARIIALREWGSTGTGAGTK